MAQFLRDFLEMKINTQLTHLGVGMSKLNFFEKSNIDCSSLMHAELQYNSEVGFNQNLF
jgi:hypothetical protein